jgi:hypothetical protein
MKRPTPACKVQSGKNYVSEIGQTKITIKVAEYTWFFPEDLYKKCIDRKVQHV